MIEIELGTIELGGVSIDMGMSTIELIAIIISFIILYYIGKFIFKKIKKHGSKYTDNRLFNPREYFPEEEIETLNQVFYLVILFLLFIFFFYNFIADKGTHLFAVAEIIFMVCIANSMDFSSWKNKLLFFLLIPYASISFVFWDNTVISLAYIINLIHIPMIVYLMVIYFRKFKEFTETNGLGITIVLLFFIIFFSFIFTMIVEGVSPLDSINMVSNAFTSNGYSVLGKSSLGKVNNLILVWGGYVISGVGTATLTAAILSKHFNKKIEDMEESYEKSNQELKDMIQKNNEEIKELIKGNN